MLAPSSNGPEPWLAGRFANLAPVPRLLCCSLELSLADLDKSAAAPEAIGLNTVANSWLRKGQCHDMLNERASARQAYSRAISLAPDSDAAREARRYSDSPYRRGR